MSERPDTQVFIQADEDETQNDAIVQKTVRELRESGFEWVRVTAVDSAHIPVDRGTLIHGFWIDGWGKEPLTPEAFKPKP